MTTSNIQASEDERILRILDSAAQDTEAPEKDLVRKFWAHDPPLKSGAKGHPRTLIAFKVDGDNIIYAATTWNPVEKFDRQHAINRVEGRLACSKRRRNIPLRAALGVHKSILEDLLERDEANDRVNTLRYRACYQALHHQTFA